MGATTLTNQIKPADRCERDGCNKHKKNPKRKYCSRKCHEKVIGSRIPTCHNPKCGKKVKRGRNLYCSWTCYKIDTDTHKFETCIRPECNNPLTSRKSSRKYCSPECYRLDLPNRPSKKIIRICQQPGCGKQIKKRGTKIKYCSVECSVKSRKTLVLAICPTCETEFQKKRSRQKFCSTNCVHGNKETKIRNVNFSPRRFSRVSLPQLNISKIEKKWILTCNVTWQKEKGEIPEGFNIWFKDNNSFNDTELSNLYLVTHKEYISLSRKVTQPESETKISKFEGREAQNPQEEQSYKKSELFTHHKHDY